MIIKVGKASDNDFIVDDPHVSRYHIQLIHEKDGSLFLEDLGSTNGKFMKGSQIKKNVILLLMK